MPNEEQSNVATRQSLAVGIWSLLGILTVLMPTGISFEISVGVLLFISACSSLALVITRSLRGRRVDQAALLGISAAVPLCWGLIFAEIASPLQFAVLVIVAVAPVIVTWLVTVPEFIRQISVSAQHTDPTPTVDAPSPLISDPQPTIYSSDEFTFQEDDESAFDIEQGDSSDLTQWMTRSIREDDEIIEGGFRIEFAEGQRDVTLHVSFCPALAGVPKVTTEDLDASNLEIRVTTAFSYGARFTVRRAANSTENPIPATSCRVGFVATCGAIRRAA